MFPLVLHSMTTPELALSKVSGSVEYQNSTNKQNCWVNDARPVLHVSAEDFVLSRTLHLDKSKEQPVAITASLQVVICIIMCTLVSTLPQPVQLAESQPDASEGPITC